MKITVTNQLSTTEAVFYDDANGNGWIRLVPGRGCVELPDGSVIKPTPEAYIRARRGQFIPFDA